MSTPIQAGPSSTPDIHHAPAFPVRATTCGVVVIPKPASDDWGNVTCRACLAIGAETDLGARAHLARRDAERAAALAADGA